MGEVVPTGPRFWQRRLFWLAVAVVLFTAAAGGYLIWWELAHVRTVRAVVCASVIGLSSEVDARLQELHVKPGNRVTAGQLVARLDDSALRATLAASQEERAIKQSLWVQAQTSATLTETSVKAEIALARTRLEMATAQVTTCEAKQALRRARIPAEISRAQAQYDEALARLRQLSNGMRAEVIEEAKARLDTAHTRVAMAEVQLQLSQEMVAKGLESGLMMQTRQTDLVARRNEERESSLRLAVLEAGATDDEVDAAKQTLAAREADLQLARSNDDELPVLAAELTSRQAEQHEAEAALAQAQSQMIQIELAKERVTAAAAELSKAEADVARCEAGLRSMSVVSPVAGTVIRTFDKVGEVARKAVPLMFVTDDSAGFWVEGFISEEDASRVRTGQQAEIEVVVGSGNFIDATVEAVALSTSSVSRDSGGFSEQLAADDSAGMVWLKLRPREPLTKVLPGMTAAAVISVSHQ